ncbi:MAG: prolyl oligopeptidase family serine peptidase [Polyangiaceae bacterium]
MTPIRRPKPAPLRQVADRGEYASILIVTAEGDSRLDPMHTRKMVARLGEAQCDPSRPILLRIERRAGHGRQPRHQVVGELSDDMAFLFKELGLS